LAVMSDGERKPLRKQIRWEGCEESTWATNRWAPAIPVLTACSFLSLVYLTKSISTGAGHCDLLVNGQPQRLLFPGVSLFTRLAPERIVWTLGVIAIFVFFLWPSVSLIWEVQKWSTLPPRGCLLSAPIGSQAFLLAGSLGILGATFMPIQADILSADASPALSTRIHLFWSAMFYFSALGHGVLVVAMQASCCSGRRRPSPKLGFHIKAALGVLAFFTVLGPVPQVLLLMCDEKSCGASGSLLREQNMVGLAQHILVLIICFFLASYYWDVQTMQQQKSEEDDIRSAMACSNSC